MGFDGPRVDAWNFFTVTVQVGKKLFATWITKQSCQNSIILEEKQKGIFNVINHLVGKTFVVSWEWPLSLNYSYCSIWQTKFSNKIFLAIKEMIFLNLFSHYKWRWKWARTVNNLKFDQRCFVPNVFLS